MPSEPVGPVIAGVDDSPMAVAVVDLAVQEAAARGVPALLLYAARAGSRGPLDAALARARAVRPALAVTGELVDGDPADALAGRSSHAAAVVLGHGGRRPRRPRRPPRGSVVLRLLSRVEAPAIVYRPPRAGRPEAPRPPVLVGVDGLPGSEAAVEFAFGEAALHGAPLLAVHLWPPADAGGSGRDRVEAEGAFLDLLETWSAKHPDVPVEIAVRHGLDAVIVLAAASRSARLMVVGMPHGVGSHPIPPGSALAALIDRAGCPIAVVPAEPPRSGTFGPAVGGAAAVR